MTVGIVNLSPAAFFGYQCSFSVKSSLVLRWFHVAVAFKVLVSHVESPLLSQM